MLKYAQICYHRIIYDQIQKVTFFTCCVLHIKVNKMKVTKALLGDFCYSQNGGGYIFWFFDIFFSMAHNHKRKSESGGLIP